MTRTMRKKLTPTTEGRVLVSPSPNGGVIVRYLAPDRVTLSQIETYKQYLARAAPDWRAVGIYDADYGEYHLHIVPVLQALAVLSGRHRVR